jgi:hypothetical protein
MICGRMFGKRGFMKKILTILFLLLILQVVFGQSEAVKFAEYNEHGFGCDGHFRLSDFTEEIKQQEGSTGLIVIYSGDSSERLGNIYGYAFGIKEHLEGWLGFPSKKIKTVITEGKTLFAEEFWIIPKNAQEPEIKPLNFDWKTLKKKTLYSKACFECEPSYGLITDFRPNLSGFAEILNNNPDYSGVANVRSFKDIRYVRKLLIKEYKLAKNQFAIHLIKSNKNEWGVRADFYIVPKQSKNK